MNNIIVKNINIIETKTYVACELNEMWHSRLPKIHYSNVARNTHSVCYLFTYHQAVIGTAIWSSPVARYFDKSKYLELRRLALCSLCPKNTATYVLSKMRRLIKDKFKNIEILISYQDTEVHLGTIYKADNWIKSVETTGGEWSSKTRLRKNVQSSAKKIRWEYII
tara:strand:+ start:41 stop:538 length:498 start_codon:yes stop_codon:yes gene_type:complete